MTGHDEVERLVAVITMDCYNLAEQVTAFYETFAEEVPLPTTATVIGTTVELVGIDIADHGEVLTARCHRGDVVQDLHLSDLVFAPDTAAGWIHADLPPLPWLGATPGRRTRRMEAVLVVSGRSPIPADAAASYRRQCPSTDRWPT
jgi:hypothetical protein